MQASYNDWVIFGRMFNIPNPDFKSLVEEKFKFNHFSQSLGLKLTKIDAGNVEATLQLEQEHLQQNNITHGGIILTLCDVVAGFAAFTLVPGNKHVVTAEIKVTCLRPGIGESLSARGWVVKPGNHLSFCESEVWCHKAERKYLIAKASTSMAVRDHL